jgi:hypothetical protein
MPAASPDAVLGLHSRHFEQANKHAELVPSRDPRQSRNGLCNELYGLIGPAIARWLVVLGAPGVARGSASPPLPCFAQNYIRFRVFLQNTLIKSATLEGILQLFG